VREEEALLEATDSTDEIHDHASSPDQRSPGRENFHLSMLGTPLRARSGTGSTQVSPADINQDEPSHTEPPLKSHITPSFQNMEPPENSRFLNDSDGASSGGTCASVLSCAILLGIVFEVSFKGLAILATNGSDVVWPSYPMYCFAMVAAIPLSGWIQAL